jgi:hypothetical protein
MKTNKRKNKTRKKINKGGHKVPYDYQGNIDAGTNKPLKGEFVHQNNCLACAMYSLGYIKEDTAHHLQRVTPNGVTLSMVLEMVNETYGPGHTFEYYGNEKSIKEYLNEGEATLGFFDRHTSNVGHYFIMFHSKNGKLYAIDSQQHLVTPIKAYLLQYEPLTLYLLTEPTELQPKHDFIQSETITVAAEKDRILYENEMALITSQTVIQKPGMDNHMIPDMSRLSVKDRVIGPRKPADEIP